MKLIDAVATGVLAVGLTVGSVAGAHVASAAPATPGIDFPQKPHHGWDDWRPGPGHGKWGRGGWFNGIDACISATGPYGNVSGFVCI
jgi:hypothetical protein